MKMPGSFHATRLQPESAGLGATLRHVGGWPVLSITGSPQTLELVLVNRTPYPLTAGPAHLRLQFRPGVLMALERIVLAPQSEAAWTLTLAAPNRHGEVTLVLAGVDPYTLAPGEAMAVRLDGISADPAGGSRATRVQLHYRGFAQASGAQVTGTRLMHLPVLRRHEPVGLPATELRSGSPAASGPFMAGFIGGADVLNDGKSTNVLRLRIVNTSERAVVLSDDDDEATRFYLSFRSGSAPAHWGLVEAQTDHVSLAFADETQNSPGWQIDHHTLRRIAPGLWRPLEALDLTLTVHSSAPAGEAQLILSYENLPHDDDGDLVLLVRLGPTAERREALVTVMPVELRGARAGLSFHPEEELGTSVENLPAPSIAVNRAEGSVGRLDVHAPVGMHLSGDLEVDGLVNPPLTFTLGGRLDRYYPVIFEDLAWERGELRFEVFRANTHVDSSWRGSLMATIVCHSDRYGHGSGHWQIEARQWSSGPSHNHFLGGFANDAYQPLHVLWLSGATTYSWRAEHPARIAPATNLHQPDAIALAFGAASSDYSVLADPQPGFNADHVSIRRLTGRVSGRREEDASEVPVGAIMLWPNAETNIPVGWAVCDGSQGTPDLSAGFPPALKYIRRLGY